MSPASNKNSIAQSQLTRLIGKANPDGLIIPECSIQTPEGTKVADVVCASDAFIKEWGEATPFPYLEAGTQEVWVVYIDSHMDIFTPAGQQEETTFSASICDTNFPLKCKGRKAINNR